MEGGHESVIVEGLKSGSYYSIYSLLSVYCQVNFRRMGVALSLVNSGLASVIRTGV